MQFMNQRIVLHVDFDYFYAQCEEIRTPALKTKPVAVCMFSNRGGDIPLTVGEMRNEKDGFPFVEDLPEELGGPLTEAVNNGLLAIPIGKVTKGRLPFP